MIIIQTILFSFFCLITILSISGLGTLLNPTKKKKLLESFFYGFLVITLTITIIHFFYKIDPIIILLIFVAGLFASIKKCKLSFKKINHDIYLYVLIFIILIPIYLSQKYHEDFGYYHLPYIINLVNEKIIFGLANANSAFAHNSIWLNILPIFYINENYNFVLIPTFLIYLVFIIYSFSIIINEKIKKISNFFLIICLFYIVLKFTRISEYGNDIPALIFTILAILNFFKFQEERNLKKKLSYFFCNFSFTVFAILIKFSVIPVLILSVYLFLKNYKNLSPEILKIRYIFIYILGITFFLQQFVYTSCFIYPSTLTCINTSWFDPTILNSIDRLELINKSYAETNGSITKAEFLKNFNWVPYWFNRNYSEILEHLLTMIFPVILFLFISNKTNSPKILDLNKIKIFILFILIGFLFWFTFSPVYRFAIIYFISMIFLITLYFYQNRVFSKKKFIILILIFLLFNFSKNIIRIYDEDKIFYGIKKIKNEFLQYKNNSNERFSVFYPDSQKNIKNGNGWQGRLCWDIKFLCSYNKIDINSFNNYLIIKKLK
ncbi:hypothetical protein OAD48_00025 [Candidatus Pelagibacter sp.]|nr:hypothetical protein [Candidatus Pelagibacter sp.]